MAKKLSKKTSKKSVRKPARTSKATSTRKSPPARRSKAKAGKQAGRLSGAKFSLLSNMASKGDFDSEAAFDLDFAIFKAVDKELGRNYEQLRKLTPARAGFWAAWWLEGEVNNGGFHQFFLNKGPVPAGVALEFHTRHGPADVAKLLALAIKALPGGRLPADYDSMMNVLVPDDLREDERLTKALDKVTDKFFDRTGQAMLEARLKFALANKAEFFV